MKHLLYLERRRLSNGNYYHLQRSYPHFPFCFLSEYRLVFFHFIQHNQHIASTVLVTLIDSIPSWKSVPTLHFSASTQRPRALHHLHWNLHADFSVFCQADLPCYTSSESEWKQHPLWILGGPWEAGYSFIHKLKNKKGSHKPTYWVKLSKNSCFYHRCHCTRQTHVFSGSACWTSFTKNNLPIFLEYNTLSTSLAPFHFWFSRFYFPYCCIDTTTDYV